MVSIMLNNTCMLALGKGEQYGLRERMENIFEMLVLHVSQVGRKLCHAGRPKKHQLIIRQSASFYGDV